MSLLVVNRKKSMTLVLNSPNRNTVRLLSDVLGILTGALDVFTQRRIDLGCDGYSIPFTGSSLSMKILGSRLVALFFQPAFSVHHSSSLASQTPHPIAG